MKTRGEIEAAICGGMDRFDDTMNRSARDLIRQLSVPLGRSRRKALAAAGDSVGGPLTMLDGLPRRGSRPTDGLARRQSLEGGAFSGVDKMGRSGYKETRKLRNTRYAKRVGCRKPLKQSRRTTR